MRPCAALFVLIAAGALFAPAAAAQPQCRNILDARDWPNPYIIVSARTVEIVGPGSSAPRHEMPLSQLADYLRRLPKSAWPCGRIVAAQQSGPRRQDDGPAIAENCSKLNKILMGLKLKVNWWPSA
jgi:hypothetical protein